MCLPQGSEEADPWRSSLGISHAPQGRGSGVHGGGRGCVLLALPRGDGGGIPGVSRVPLPTSAVPDPQRPWGEASARVSAMTGRKRDTEGIQNSSPLILLSLETDKTLTSICWLPVF